MNFKFHIDAYYRLKPFIPRRLQLALRRKLVNMRLSRTSSWPIDERAGEPPEGWTGWPEGKKFALVLTHDVDTSKGLTKCRALAEIEREMGFRSSFNFVPERYELPIELRRFLTENSFEVGVHDLNHDGKLFKTEKLFNSRAVRINQYIRDWNAQGFRSGAMLRNLKWMHGLDMLYDASTFDTDPFEPQSGGVGTIFPFQVMNGSGEGYVELPYTLPQDFTLFVLMKEKNIDIWKRKLDWIAEKGGMALLTVHPDYMSFNGSPKMEEYPAEHYRALLDYARDKYEGQYWHVLPEEMAKFWRQNYRNQDPKRLRACMVAYTFYEADNRVKRYSEALAERGDSVDVIALRRKGQSNSESINGVNVHRIQERIVNERGSLSYIYRLAKFFLKSSFHLAKLNFKEPYDVIHVHNVPDFEVFAALLPKLTGSKVILDIHDILPEFYASKFGGDRKSLIFKMLCLLERLSARFSDHVIVSNDIWQKTLIERSVSPERCTVILNYPDSATFHRRTEKKERDKFVMLYPGTLNWHQGLDIAVMAFERISGAAPEAELHIYGEGPSRPALEKMVSEMGLEDRVLLKDFLPISEIAGVMAEADVGVVPKRANDFGNEAFSTKILEFMALGVPVIAPDTKIDKFYFDDSLVKFFRAGDHEDLAEKMLEMRGDRKLRERLARNSLRYIRENNWTVKRGIYLGLVDSLTGHAVATSNKAAVEGDRAH